MKRVLTLSLATLMLTSGAALADRGGGWQGGGMAGPGMQRMLDAVDLDRDGNITDAEMDRARAEAFAALDLNGDEVLSDAEIAAAQDAARQAIRNMMALQPILGPGAMRAVFVSPPDPDIDGDGQISAEEFIEVRGRAFERLDRNDDGTISAEEIDRMREHRRGHRGPRHSN